MAPMIELEPDEELTTFDTRPMILDAEPAVSSRATRRDLSVPELAPSRAGARVIGPRGEFSIPSIRGIPSDVVSGSIVTAEVDAARPGSRRRGLTTPPVATVHLAHATRRDITVMVEGQPLKLDRLNAMALAQIILTAFG